MNDDDISPAEELAQELFNYAIAVACVAALCFTLGVIAGLFFG